LAKLRDPLHSVEARGAVGALVYNTTRGVRYAKTNTAPSQPRTAAQLAVRALMTTFSRAWAALTQVQRDAWETFAAARPESDWTGAMLRLTGANMFTRLNVIAGLAGGAQISDPPATDAPAPASGLAASAPSGDLVLNWTGNLPAGIKLDVWLLGPVSTGVQGRFERARHVLYSAAAAAGPLTVVADVPSGRWVMWVRTVDPSTGLTSGWTKLTTDVP
jgi:hypothetical protein